MAAERSSVQSLLEYYYPFGWGRLFQSMDVTKDFDWTKTKQELLTHGKAWIGRQ